MKTVTFSIIIKLVLCLFIADAVCAQQSFHSVANLSDTDKVYLLIQKFNDAIASQNTQAVLRTINIELRWSLTDIDSISNRLETVYARVDSLGTDKSIEVPEFHTLNPVLLEIGSDHASLRHTIYLGNDPTNYCAETIVNYSNWRGIFGISNPYGLVDVLDTILIEALSDPEFASTAKLRASSTANKNPSSSTDQYFQIKEFMNAHDEVPSIGVLTKSTARANLNNQNLFSRPYDVAENYTINSLGSEYWGMAVTDANWDRYIYFGEKNLSDGPIINSKSASDLNSIGFRFPSAVTSRTDADFYVCDSYNGRVLRYMTDLEATPPVFTEYDFIYKNFDWPVDIDVAMIPHYLNITYCQFDHWVAVCDRGANKIIITQNQGGYETEIGSGILNNPTSVAFARYWQMGWQSHDLYVADAGNSRIAKFYSVDDVADYEGIQYSNDSVFEDNAYVSSVEVDNFGQVYAIDYYNGYLYKFDEDLNLIGRWGGRGTGIYELYYPIRMSITRGWKEDFYFGECDGIFRPIQYGDLLITGLYTDSTGIRRYEVNSTFNSYEAGYQERLCNDDNDFIYVDWNQSDYGYLRVKIQGENFLVDETSIYAPGNHYENWKLPYNSPMVGSYNVELWLTSCYGDATPDYKYAAVQTYRDTCNYPPLITDLYLVENDDSCVVDNYTYTCRAVATDNNNPGQLSYKWLANHCMIFDTLGTYDQFVDSLEGPGMSEVIIKINKDNAVKSTESNMALKPMKDLDEIITVVVKDPSGTSRRRAMSAYIHDYESECNYDPEPGCPLVYWNNGGQWEFINNLMAEVEDEDRPDEKIFELFPVFGISTDANGDLNLRITEEADEVTAMQSLRAALFSYPASATVVFTDRNRPLALTGQFVLPSLAYTQQGDTITDLLQSSDGSKFIDANPGSIYIEYDIETDPDAYLKPTIADPGGIILPPPDKSIEKPNVIGSEETSIYSIFALTEADTWELVSKIFPRIVNTGHYLEFSDYIVQGRLSVRIDYSSGIEVDFAPYSNFFEVNVAPIPTQLVSATYNSTDVQDQLGDDDDDDIYLKQGEYIDFTLHGAPPEFGRKQFLLIATRGSYEDEGDFELPWTNITFNQNYPNPFNPNTTFSFYLPEARFVKLEIFNILGQKVKTLVNDQLPSGRHQVEWNSKNSAGEQVASGVYFARFKAGDYQASKKIEVLK